MKKFLIFILVALALVGGAVLLLRPAGVQIRSTLYTSDEFGIRFSYPTKYFIAYESTVGGERKQHTIVLAEDTPANRSLFSNQNLATDSPPTITITLFQNNLDNYSAQSFVEGTNFSNFKLSDGTIAEVRVGGEPGLRYSATGLYENKNVVVARPSYVYMFTAFFDSPTSQILTDFDNILMSVEFSNPIISENNAPSLLPIDTYTIENG